MEVLARLISYRRDRDIKKIILKRLGKPLSPPPPCSRAGDGRSVPRRDCVLRPARRHPAYAPAKTATYARGERLGVNPGQPR